MVAIEGNEKNTMEIGAEPDSEEDFEFVCKKPQWVPEGYTLKQEEYCEDFYLYQKDMKTVLKVYIISADEQ